MSKPNQKHAEKTIVVVDDDKAIRELIIHKLTKLGYKAIGCGEAEAAFAEFEQRIPHLVCLDLALPTSSGFEVCEFMRADPSLVDVPVLVITARVGLEDHARALEVGADEVLEKPFRFPELADHVERLLLQGRQHTEA